MTPKPRLRLPAPARPLRHPGALPRLHQACDPADGREEAVAGSGETQSDHDPTPDTEPHAPVHVQRPLRASDESSDCHPDSGDDQSYRKDGQEHRGGNGPELTSFKLGSGRNDPLSPLVRGVEVRRHHGGCLAGDLRGGLPDTLFGPLLDPLHGPADAAHELAVLFGLVLETVNRRGRSRAILLRFRDQTLRRGVQALPVETLHELAERLLDLGQPALDALGLR